MSVDLARFIEHTLLRPEAGVELVDRLCEEAVAHRFHAVCVNPVWVERCAERLAGAAVAVCSVAGFPLGASCTDIKAAEARRAVQCGAGEVDMVARLDALIAMSRQAIVDDIRCVVDAVRSVNPKAAIKVILETALLAEGALAAGCACALEAGADFVKTSTGFHPVGGATLEAVRCLRKHAGRMGVKAAGGIRTREAALAMLEAGATRIGTSNGVSLVQGF